ncbi:hypothetical protein H1S01_17840 [Heliobacterium chlorum]|uniref:Uncharacterized protein n=1 Tax=Heliobacterium chlorum TaxID=2698 RepID=A0ABR7T8R2_HELCL|nr:hypothetical protein [Heliobacterium chlorum]MBC9786324.1 hypothetical protein [Heliobacterium chlorum]
MEEFRCFGEDRRKEIVAEYHVKPIAHVRLLNHQEKHSCTGKLLTESYYCFSYQKKLGNDKVIKTFFCGRPTAEHFLKLLNMQKLKMFDPLRHEEGRPGGNGGVGGGVGGNLLNWDPLAKELSNAINLTLIYKDKAPEGTIAKIKYEIESSPNNRPLKHYVKSVNTIMKGLNRKNLQEVISELKSKGNNIRNFDFSIANTILDEYIKEDDTIVSYFG